jgi:hypothetical protein
MKIMTNKKYRKLQDDVCFYKQAAANFKAERETLCNIAEQIKKAWEEERAELCEELYQLTRKKNFTKRTVRAKNPAEAK